MRLSDERGVSTLLIVLGLAVVVAAIAVTQSDRGVFMSRASKDSREAASDLATVDNAAAIVAALIRSGTLYVDHNGNLTGATSGANWTIAYTSGLPTPTNPARLKFKLCGIDPLLLPPDIAAVHGSGVIDDACASGRMARAETRVDFVGLDQEGWLQGLIYPARLVAGAATEVGAPREGRWQLPLPTVTVTIATPILDYTAVQSVEWKGRNAKACGLAPGAYPMNDPQISKSGTSGGAYGVAQVWNSPAFNAAYTVICTPLSYGHKVPGSGSSAPESRRCFGSGGPINMTGISRSSGQAAACAAQIASGVGGICDPSSAGCAGNATGPVGVACNWVHPPAGLAGSYGGYPPCTCINGADCPGSSGYPPGL